MAKQRSRAEYSAMLKTVRSFARGFDAGDGYNLHDFDSWPPARKAQVTKYFGEVDRLRSRPTYIFRARREDHLRRAQEMAQHDPKFKKIKVALVPFYDPKRGGPEAKTRKLTFNKESIVTDAGYYKRRVVPLDPMRLATDTAGEVNRALKTVPNGKLFNVQAGIFEITQGSATDAGSLLQKIQYLMSRYDGIKPLPSAYKSRRAMKGDADSPTSHHWSKWLGGIIAYEYNARPDPARLKRDIEAAKDALAKKRKAARRKRRK